jgi:hypothetical protein
VAALRGLGRLHRDLHVEAEAAEVSVESFDRDAGDVAAPSLHLDAVYYGLPSHGAPV